jgi:hypothetical protein
VRLRIRKARVPLLLIRWSWVRFPHTTKYQTASARARSRRKPIRLPILVCICVLVTVTACVSTAPKSSQHSQPHILEGPGPYNWDCVAASAHFDSAYAPAVSDHLKVTGVMHVLTMHVNLFDQWAPTASVEFDSKQLCADGVSFQLQVMPPDQDKIRFVLRGDGDGWLSMTVIASQANKVSEIPFMLTLDKGIVSFTAASSGLVSTSGVPQKISAASKTPRSDLTRVGLSCSGAHIQFSKVVVSIEP